MQKAVSSVYRSKSTTSKTLTKSVIALFSPRLATCLVGWPTLSTDTFQVFPLCDSLIVKVRYTAKTCLPSPDKLCLSIVEPMSPRIAPDLHAVCVAHLEVYL